MPSKTSKKGGKKKNKKLSDKKQKPIDATVRNFDVHDEDIVTLDVKSVFISNIQNNNEADVKDLENVNHFKNETESVNRKVSEVNLDDAFVCDQVNNNNNNVIVDAIKDASKGKASSVSPLSEKNSSSPALRKRCLSRRDCKTIDDYVDAGVPRHIAEMKHPLASTWTIWYHGNAKELTWDQNYRAIVSVSTVEDFWAVVNHLKLASKLEPGCDYSLFKAGVRPDWEDPANCGGGRWHIASSQQARESGQLDSWWTELLLILVGEQAEKHGRFITGAVVNIKPRADKLAVWLGDSKDYNSVMAIGRLIKKRLCLGEYSKIVFSVHGEDKKKCRSGSGSSPGKICL